MFKEQNTTNSIIEIPLGVEVGNYRSMLINSVKRDCMDTFLKQLFLQTLKTFRDKEVSDNDKISAAKAFFELYNRRFASN